MGDVSPRILSRLNGYYCREARTLIPPRGPPRRHTRTHAFEYHEGETWCGRRRRWNVQHGAAHLTKRGVPLAELTR